MASVLMLVINPMTADTRVEKEADSLGRAGHEVTVIATHLPGLPDKEDRGTYVVRRLPYRRVVKERLVAQRQRGRDQRREVRHALLAALQYPPRRHRRLSLLFTYVHLVVIYLKGMPGWFTWLLGGSLLKGLRSRILPVEYWRGTASRIPELVERCDVIHVHDLGPLSSGVRLATHWARSHPQHPRPRVVYDSHEYYVEQNTNWTAWEKRLWGMHERRWIRRADAVITVSPGIAGALARRYGLPRVPVVVYNSPPTGSRSATSDIRQDVGLDEDVPLVVYVGGVKPGRGVEQLVPVLALGGDLHLAIIGAGHTSDPHLAAVLAEATRVGVRERVHVLPPVPAVELVAYLGTADVGIHPMEPTCVNHDLALPNKLFDYVFAGLPVAVSDLTEMRTFVAGNGVGRTFDPGDPASVHAAISEVLRHPTQYRASPDTITRIADTYGWATQSEVLCRLYSCLLSQPSELKAS